MGGRRPWRPSPPSASFVFWLFFFCHRRHRCRTRFCFFSEDGAGVGECARTSPRGTLPTDVGRLERRALLTGPPIRIRPPPSRRSVGTVVGHTPPPPPTAVSRPAPPSPLALLAVPWYVPFVLFILPSLCLPPTDRPYLHPAPRRRRPRRRPPRRRRRGGRRNAPVPVRQPVGGAAGGARGGLSVAAEKGGGGREGGDVADRPPWAVGVEPSFRGFGQPRSGAPPSCRPHADPPAAPFPPIASTLSPHLVVSLRLACGCAPWRRRWPPSCRPPPCCGGRNGGRRCGGRPRPRLPHRRGRRRRLPLPLSRPPTGRPPPVVPSSPTPSSSHRSWD